MKSFGLCLIITIQVLTLSCKHSANEDSLLQDDSQTQKAQTEFLKLCTANSNLDLMYALLDNDGSYRWVTDSFRGAPQGFYQNVPALQASKPTLDRFREILVSGGEITLTKEDCQSLTQHLNKLQHLELIFTRKYNDDSDSGLMEEFQVDISPIAHFTQIKSLRVFGGGIGLVKSFSFLKNLTKLEYLNLSTSSHGNRQKIQTNFADGLTMLRFAQFTEVDFNDLSGLAGMTNLEHLTIMTSNIGRLNGLEKLKKMTHLTLYEVMNHQDPYKEQTKTPFESLKPINALSQLKKLSLTAVGLNDQLFSNLIPEQLPALEILSVARNEYFTDKVAFAKFKSLKNFEINESGLEFENQTAFWTYVAREFPELQAIAKDNLKKLKAMNSF